MWVLGGNTKQGKPYKNYICFKNEHISISADCKYCCETAEKSQKYFVHMPPNNLIEALMDLHIFKRLRASSFISVKCSDEPSAWINSNSKENTQVICVQETLIFELKTQSIVIYKLKIILCQYSI